MRAITLKTASKKTSVSKLKIKAAVKKAYATSPSTEAKDDVKIVILMKLPASK